MLFFCCVQPKIETTEADQIQNDAMYGAFSKVAGEDMEIDAYELLDILNAAFMKGRGAFPLIVAFCSFNRVALVPLHKWSSFIPPLVQSPKHILCSLFKNTFYFRQDRSILLDVKCCCFLFGFKLLSFSFRIVSFFVKSFELFCYISLHTNPKFSYIFIFYFCFFYDSDSILFW